MTGNLVRVSNRLRRPLLWIAAVWGVFILIALSWVPVSAGSDGDIPFVVSHTPPSNAIHVPVDEVITVAWSQPMAADTNFVVTGPMGFVSGTFAYDELGFSVSFAPDKDFVPAARYGVVVAGQTDVKGHVQIEVVQWSFNTESPTSVSLADFNAKPTVRQSWWWSAWPWLMLLISAVSLIGFVRMWTRQRSPQMVERPE